MAETAAQTAAIRDDAVVPVDPSLPKVGGAYAWYVLIVLVVVYIFNFIDRSILTILGPFIAKDLGLSDGQLGLLSGTVFALFYGLFGLALGRLADTWVRTWTIALGLTLWSGMTALSGFASSFGQLAIARVGVGVGEASASPAAYSLIGDWFPKSMRATALAIYSSGIFIGAGLSFAISGVVVQGWEKAYAGGGAPLGLAGWQAAFLIIGIPGLLLAGLVMTLREPPRGLADGLISRAPREPRPFYKTLLELGTVLPPFTVINLRAIGAPASIVRNNVIGMALAVFAAIALTQLTDALIPADKVKILFNLGGFDFTANALQWAAMAVGIYGVFSWSQSLKVRDAPLHALMWRTPVFLQTAMAGTLGVVWQLRCRCVDRHLRHPRARRVARFGRGGARPRVGGRGLDRHLARRCGRRCLAAARPDRASQAQPDRRRGSGAHRLLRLFDGEPEHLLPRLFLRRADRHLLARRDLGDDARPRAAAHARVGGRDVLHGDDPARPRQRPLFRRAGQRRDR